MLLTAEDDSEHTPQEHTPQKHTSDTAFNDIHSDNSLGQSKAKTAFSLSSVIEQAVKANKDAKTEPSLTYSAENKELSVTVGKGDGQPRTIALFQRAKSHDPHINSKTTPTSQLPADNKWSRLRRLVSQEATDKNTPSYQKWSRLRR